MIVNQPTDFDRMPTHSPTERTEALVHRLAGEIRQQLSVPVEQSPQFFSDAYAQLKSIEPQVGGALLIECLLNIAQYFYLCGAPFQGIEPANRAAAFAWQLGDQAVLRKAL